MLNHISLVDSDPCSVEGKEEREDKIMKDEATKGT